MISFTGRLRDSLAVQWTRERGRTVRKEPGMTRLLRRAIAEIEKLPAETQDALASRILADLTDEAAWESRFEATSPGQWDRLADLARQEISSGETVPLDEIFPVKAVLTPSMTLS